MSRFGISIGGLTETITFLHSSLLYQEPLAVEMFLRLGAAKTVGRKSNTRPERSSPRIKNLREEDYSHWRRGRRSHRFLLLSRRNRRGFTVHDRLAPGPLK